MINRTFGLFFGRLEILWLIYSRYSFITKANNYFSFFVFTPLHEITGKIVSLSKNNGSEEGGGADYCLIVVGTNSTVLSHEKHDANTKP